MLKLDEQLDGVIMTAFAASESLKTAFTEIRTKLAAIESTDGDTSKRAYLLERILHARDFIDMTATSVEKGLHAAQLELTDAKMTISEAKSAENN